MKFCKNFFVVLASVLALAACSSGDAGGSSTSNSGDTGTTDGTDGTGTTDGTDGTVDGGTGNGPTWHADVRILIEQNCQTCHSQDGIGEFPLSNFEEVSTLAPLIADAVSQKRMPPWMPADDCRQFFGARNLDDEQIETITQWVEAGAPEGNAADYIPPADEPGSQHGEPSLVLDAGVEYTADIAFTDDYRCLVLDHEFQQDTFVTGVNVVPGAGSVVHHVLLYVVPKENLPALQALDDGDEGPGYTCFGGPKVSAGGTIGGWVPGMVPAHYPEGAAFFVPEGSRVVMQVHYNLNDYDAANPPPPDQTTVAFWTLAPGQSPSQLVSITGFAHSGIQIPAGEANVVQEKVFPVPAGATVIGTAPHMHLLGKAIKATLQRKDGSETCIVDVPVWDFNWQQFYFYDPADYLTTKVGDSIKLTCVYDNSPSNQPYIDNVQIQPKHVAWGEGTFDEMCLNYVIALSPWAEDKLCPTVEPCLSGCDPGDSECFVVCLTQNGGDCMGCLLPQMGKCATKHCTAQMQSLNQCLNSCSGESCLFEECNDEFKVVYICLEPHINSGACDAALAECGVSLGSK